MNAAVKETPKQEHVETKSAVTAGRVIKVAAESAAPGGSLFLDGKIGLGALHLVGAGLARTFLGPAGVALVALNSYSKSVSGKHLHERILRS